MDVKIRDDKYFNPFNAERGVTLIADLNVASGVFYFVFIFGHFEGKT